MCCAFFLIFGILGVQVSVWPQESSISSLVEISCSVGSSTIVRVLLLAVYEHDKNVKIKSVMCGATNSIISIICFKYDAIRKR